MGCGSHAGRRLNPHLLARALQRDPPQLALCWHLSDGTSCSDYLSFFGKSGRRGRKTRLESALITLVSVAFYRKAQPSLAIE